MDEVTHEKGPETPGPGPKASHPGEALPGSAILLGDVLTRLEFEVQCSPSRERALAITKAEEALMWVTRGSEKEVAARKSLILTDEVAEAALSRASAYVEHHCVGTDRE